MIVSMMMASASTVGLWLRNSSACDSDVDDGFINVMNEGYVNNFTTKILICGFNERTPTSIVAHAAAPALSFASAAAPCQ